MHPRLIEASGRPPDDNYRLTLEGLLLSNAAQRARDLIEHLLRHLRKLFRDDPDFKEFTWGALAPELGVNDTDFQFVDAIISGAEMMYGSGGSFHSTGEVEYRWGTPKDIENLVHLNTADDFINYLRHRHEEKRRSTMSVKEDAGRILHAIAEFEESPGDSRRGRHSLDGEGIREGLKAQQNYDMEPERINEAVEILEKNGYVKVTYYTGTFPYRFGIVELTAAGRIQYEEMQERTPSKAKNKSGPVADAKKVFVIHGRDEKRRKAMFDFLRAIGLQPIEWSQARAMTGNAAPYIGEILEAAFSSAQAVVALFTGDDEAHIRSELLEPGDSEEPLTPQARPNVLFEAGMAMGSHEKRTVFVEVGRLRPFSDFAGRHTIRINPHGGPVPVKDRQEIAARLKDAGCDTDLSGTDWHTAGEF